MKIKLRHFLPGDDHAVVCHSLPVEDVLFQKERKLSYDAEGFLEDAYDSRSFVRVEECAR